MRRSLSTIIQADLCRHGGAAGFRALLWTYTHVPGFRFLYHLRAVAHYRRSLLAAPLYIYHRLMLNHCRFRYGLDISPAAAIGPGLYIGHFGGVVVSPYAVLGANCNIAQGVTIGAISRGPKTGAPLIGDRVWIGAHAIVVGKISVGNDALIGPGAYVNFDVPPNSVVLGNPGKVVSQAGSAGYVNHLYQPDASSPAPIGV